MAFCGVNGNLLLAGCAPCAATFGCVDSDFGDRPGGAIGDTRDRSPNSTRSEVAQRCSVKRQESLRDPYGDEFRSDARALHRGWDRIECESRELSRGTGANRDFTAHGHGDGMVANRNLRRFAKILRLRVQQSASKSGSPCRYFAT